MVWSRASRCTLACATRRSRVSLNWIRRTRPSNRELVGYLDDPDQDISISASLALGDRGDPAAIAPLEAMLNRSDVSPDLARFIQRTLARLKRAGPGGDGQPSVKPMPPGLARTREGERPRPRSALQEAQHRTEGFLDQRTDNRGSGTEDKKAAISLGMTGYCCDGDGRRHQAACRQITGNGCGRVITSHAYWVSDWIFAWESGPPEKNRQLRRYSARRMRRSRRLFPVGPVSDGVAELAEETVEVGAALEFLRIEICGARPLQRSAIGYQRPPRGLIPSLPSVHSGAEDRDLPSCNFLHAVKHERRIAPAHAVADDRRADLAVRDYRDAAVRISMVRSRSSRPSR